MTHPGEMVKNLLAREGWNVTEGAEALGVSRVALSNLVNEKADLSVEMAVRVSKVFDMPLGEVLKVKHTLELVRAQQLVDRMRSDATLKFYRSRRRVG